MRTSEHEIFNLPSIFESGVGLYPNASGIPYVPGRRGPYGYYPFSRAKAGVRISRSQVTKAHHVVSRDNRVYDPRQDGWRVLNKPISRRKRLKLIQEYKRTFRDV